MIPIHPEVVISQFSESLTALKFPPGEDVRYDDLLEEFTEYANVLLGRSPSPIQSPYLSLMEVATAYHARAREVEMEIYTLEQDGIVKRGDLLYRFRTGQLNSFIEMSRKCIDLGSRRLTQETILSQMRTD